MKILQNRVIFALEEATKAQRGSRYRLTLSLTSAQDGWVVYSTPRGRDAAPIVQEAGWAPGPV